MADRWHVIEDEMFPEDLEDLTGLRDQLLARGYTRASVAGCIDFVLGKARGKEVNMPPSSKSKYRKMLASVAVGDEPPPEAGYVPIELLPLGALVMGLAAAVMTHQSHLSALLPAVGDITGPEGEELPCAA